MKKAISFILTTVMLISLLAAFNVSGFAAATEIEPNDSFSSATQISTNTSYSGNLSKKSDADYYKFTLSSDGHVTLQFSHKMLDTTGSVFQAYIYDAQQAQVSYYYLTGNLTEHNMDIGLAKGTYYIRIDKYNKSSDTGVNINYTLNVKFTSTSYWEKEDNGAFTKANTVTANNVYNGNLWQKSDADYYKITLSSNGCLSLVFSHTRLDTTNSVFQAYIYDSQQTQLSYYYLTGNLTEHTMNIGLAKGTYYIRIDKYNKSSDAGVFVNYTLNTKFTSTQYWEKEDNNAFTKANSIELDKYYSGNLWSKSDSDYYKFTLTDDKKVYINLAHDKLDSTNSVWSVFVYNSDQGQLSKYYFNGSESSHIVNIGLSKGTYYVKVEKYNKSSDIAVFANYKLNVAVPLFPDVLPNAWYYEAVTYVAQKGYMGGYSNGKFGPADNLKRQDFVMILARIAEADLSKYGNKASSFSDVKKGSYYYSAVMWAVENGIIGGYSNGKFGVGDNITREQVATILYRYAGSPTVNNVDSTLKKFSDDNNISSFARTSLAWAVQKGVISGMADGRIAPTEGASRAQIAMIVMRMDQQGMFKH